MQYPMGHQAFPGRAGPPRGPPGYGGGHPHHPAYHQHYGGVRAGNAPPPPSQHYGSYGQNFSQNVFSVNAAQALGYNTQDDLCNLFESKKSQRFQAIQAEELCQILNESPNIRDYYRINWSLELCKVMMAMLDRSRDGMMQYAEFCELLQCLTYWHQCFCQYDTDRSGFIEAHELGRVFRDKFGYQLSSKALETVLKRYSRAMEDGRTLVAFDDFVSCCVRLRAYTEAFRARDRQATGGTETGNCTFGYDDFLQCVMCL